jgi:hypothetical protein
VETEGLESGGLESARRDNRRFGRLIVLCFPKYNKILTKKLVKGDSNRAPSRKRQQPHPPH